MLKKAIKGLVIGAAALGMFAGTATADNQTYNMNIYGASAQHKFWLNLAPDFLTNSAGCTTVNSYKYDSKHGAAVGTGCDLVDSTNANDTIIIRYSSRASYDGIIAVSDGTTRNMCNDTCSSLTPVVVNLGASDVAGLSFQTSTTGWEDGDQSFPNDEYSTVEEFDFPDEDTMDGLEQFNPIVVPFGFLVNNAATEYRCTAPAPPTGTTLDEKAYDKFGWSCVPDSNYACSDGTSTDRVTCEAADGTWDLVADNTPTGASGNSADCIGYYKCLGYVPAEEASCAHSSVCVLDGTGTAYDVTEATCEGYATYYGTTYTWTDTSEETACTDAGLEWAGVDEVLGTCNGGLNATQSCATANDCPDAVVGDTLCKEVPVSNITQAMARQIFSGGVDNWGDFGPSYVDQAIVRCMRHSGSGTHATMNLAVMDGATLLSSSVEDETWHYTSSSDLTKCVTDFDGAVGYVDVDKLLTFAEVGDVKGAHTAKYNGAAPIRRNIVNGTYEFWAAQHVYYKSSSFTSGGDYDTILQAMITYSSDPANLTTATLGNAALFWAAQSEMQVRRETDGAIIER